VDPLGNAPEALDVADMLSSSRQQWQSDGMSG
jgi:hypothetical protein